MRYLLIAGLILAACRPQPKPPANGDTTAVDTGTVDTAPVVAVPDSIDSLTFFPETIPEVTPADTAAAWDSITAQAQRRHRSAPRTAAAAAGGLAFGLSTYLPTFLWCNDHYFNATIVAGRPKQILPILRLAKRCNMRVAFTIPRDMMATTGRSSGPFSMARANDAVDQIAKAVPVDSAKKYAPQILYLSGLDDMGCPACWGGRIIDGATTRDHLVYVKQKLGDRFPIGLRVGTNWMAKWHIDWKQSVDVITAQYITRLGDQESYYEQMRNLLPQVGVAKIVYTVNVHSCGGPREPDPCTPDELATLLPTALNQDPATNCGFIGWKYDQYDVAKAKVQYDAANKLAATKTNPTTCAR